MPNKILVPAPVPHRSDMALIMIDALMEYRRVQQQLMWSEQDRRTHEQKAARVPESHFNLGL